MNELNIHDDKGAGEDQPLTSITEVEAETWLEHKMHRYSERQAIENKRFAYFIVFGEFPPHEQEYKVTGTTG